MTDTELLEWIIMCHYVHCSDWSSREGIKRSMAETKPEDPQPVHYLSKAELAALTEDE